MHLDAFTALLDRREELRREHTDWCEAINDGSEDDFYSRSRRDRAYARLVATEEQIEAELDAERAAETEQTEQEGT